MAAFDLREDGLEQTRALAGGHRLATFPLDVSDREATAASLDLVVGELGPVDGLVDVAGIMQPFVRINDLDWETIEHVMNVNFYGTLNMVKRISHICCSAPKATSPTCRAWVDSFRCPDSRSTGRRRQRSS